jgi:DnaK suppressor protein
MNATAKKSVKATTAKTPAAESAIRTTADKPARKAATAATESSPAKAKSTAPAAKTAGTTAGTKRAAPGAATKARPESPEPGKRMSADNAGAGLQDKIDRTVVSKVTEVATKTPKSAPAADGALLSEAQLLKMGEKDYMNAAQLAFFKARLQQLERDLLKNAGETTEHLRETVLVPDPADRATIEEEHALELRTRDRERKLLTILSRPVRMRHPARLAAVLPLALTQVTTMTSPPLGSTDPPRHSPCNNLLHRIAHTFPRTHFQAD